MTATVHHVPFWVKISHQLLLAEKITFEMFANIKV